MEFGQKTFFVKLIYLISRVFFIFLAHYACDEMSIIFSIQTLGFVIITCSKYGIFREEIPILVTDFESIIMAFEHIVPEALWFEKYF